MKKKLSLIVSLIAIMIISSVMPVDASSEIDDTEAIRFEINKQELSEGDTFTLQANIVDDSLDIDKLVVKYRLENTDDIKDLELVYNPDKELWELDLEINKDWQDGVWKLHKVKYSLSEDESYQKLEWQEHFTNGDFIVNKITEPTASTEEDTQNVQSNNSTVEPKNIEEVSLAAYNKIQTLSNSLYYETYYNKTLEEILDTQMTKGPQTDLYDGRWKNAKREDVEYYLNPENFLQFNSTIGSNENKIVEVTADILNVRERPSTTSTVITQVKKGSKYTVLAKSNDWYKINANGKTGWISGNYIIATSNIRYINSVQVMVDVLNVREKPTIESSRISQVKNGDVYIVLDESDGWCKINNNGKIGWISGNYVQLVNNVPRDMYQFLVLSGPSGVSADDLNNALRGKGILAGKGQAFIEAGKQHNVNELYLLSHAFLETGNGTSKLATGILVDKVDGKAVTPRVVYNMFGIGAADKDPLRLGAEYAYKEGWFTPEAAIIGGAKFISKSYINNPNYQQDTLYKMRWNPISPGSHQYATDIGWAVKQTRNIDIMVEIYAQSSSANLKFDIPKYGGYVEEVDEEEDNTPKISTIEVVADVLNVREKASTSSTRITQVKKGSKYTVLAESNGWYKISANGKTGWVYGEHVKEAKEEDNTPKISTVEVVADVLNVREKASTASSIITQVKKGSKYTVLAESNGWYKISANGKTGWVYGEHVKEAKESKISVFLDPGHGGKDPGASGNGLKEKDVALSIALKTGEILKKHNINVKYSRTTDVFVELSDRAGMANNANADVFVSLHCNSFTEGSAKGVETYHYPGSTEGTKLAKCIQNSILRNGVYNSNRGVKQENFAVLRQTKMPAALVETAFITNSQDANILKNKQDAMAQAIAMGILDYLKI